MHNSGWRSVFTQDFEVIVPLSPGTYHTDKKSAVASRPSRRPSPGFFHRQLRFFSCLWRCEVSLRKIQMQVRLVLPSSGLILLHTGVSCSFSVLENPWPFTLRILPLPRVFLPSHWDPQEPGCSPSSSTPPICSGIVCTPFHAALWVFSSGLSSESVFLFGWVRGRPSPQQPGDTCPPRTWIFPSQRLNFSFNSVIQRSF